MLKVHNCKQLQEMPLCLCLKSRFNKTVLVCASTEFVLHLV